MKVYEGHPPGHVTVTDDSGQRRMLRPRLDLANHSPDGFAWGYGGSGPGQLALAILADALGDDDRARALYQRYKFAAVARWPKDSPWITTSDDILRIVAEIDDRK